MRSYSQKADTVTMHSDLIQVIVIIWEILMCWLHTTSGQRIKALARLSITCGTTQSCSNATTEFYTCQKFGSEIDQRLEISYIFTHNHCVFLSVNTEHGWRGWERWSLKSEQSWVLSITCGTTQSCSNVTTEFYTCQKFGSEIDQRLEINYIFTHNHYVFLSVNAEHGWRGWERWSLKSEQSWVRPWS